MKEGLLMPEILTQGRGNTKMKFSYTKLWIVWTSLAQSMLHEHFTSVCTYYYVCMTVCVCMYLCCMYMDACTYVGI